ncbi:MAG: MCE family protein [Geminicoccaceae bacterium]|nr:MAG: MCE family protein [Geminicoccaceae bacterium]
METRASHVLVGLFVVALTLATAAFGLWLGRMELDRSVDVYDVAFGTAVTGLQKGAQVTYQGVPVGRVVDIRFDPERLDRVLVRVEVDPTTPITEDTGAQLAPQGITGLFFVQLIPGTPGSLPLATAADAPAVIAAVPSPLDRLVTDFPEVLAQGVILLDRAVQLLSNDNLQSFGRTLANVEALSETLAGRRDDVDGLLADTAVIAQEFRAAAAALRALLDRVDGAVGVVEGELPELLRGATVSLAGLGDVSRRMERVALQLDGLLQDVREPMRDFAEAGLYEFNALIGETRLLVAAATRISREFERDPAGFLLGGSFTGFRAD